MRTVTLSPLAVVSLRRRHGARSGILSYHMGGSLGVFGGAVDRRRAIDMVTLGSNQEHPP